MESKTKILLAEDDPNLGQILKEYLEVKGYESTLTSNGESACHSLPIVSLVIQSMETSPEKTYM